MPSKKQKITLPHTASYYKERLTEIAEHTSEMNFPFPLRFKENTITGNILVEGGNGYFEIYYSSYGGRSKQGSYACVWFDVEDIIIDVAQRQWLQIVSAIWLMFFCFMVICVASLFWFSIFITFPLAIGIAYIFFVLRKRWFRNDIIRFLAQL